MAHFEDPLPQEPAVEMEMGDRDFQAKLMRLHQVTVYGRWLLAGLLWVFLFPLCVWALRSDIVLWHDYFTWAAVRYAFAFNPWAALGFALCVGMTVSVLVWQSRNILFGIPESETKRLKNLLIKIHQQGPSHPLWKWVYGEQKS